MRQSRVADGIWIIDSEAKTLYANGAMAEILGTELSRLIGEPSFNYVFPEDVVPAQWRFEARQREKRRRRFISGSGVKTARRSGWMFRERRCGTWPANLSGSWARSGCRSRSVERRGEGPAGLTRTIEPLIRAWECVRHAEDN